MNPLIRMMESSERTPRVRVNNAADRCPTCHDDFRAGDHLTPGVYHQKTGVSVEGRPLYAPVRAIMHLECDQTGKRPDGYVPPFQAATKKNNSSREEKNASAPPIIESRPMNYPESFFERNWSFIGTACVAGVMVLGTAITAPTITAIHLTNPQTGELLGNYQLDGTVRPETRQRFIEAMQDLSTPEQLRTFLNAHDRNKDQTLTQVEIGWQPAGETLEIRVEPGSQPQSITNAPNDLQNMIEASTERR